MGVNMLPAAALIMMMSMNLMGAGGRRLINVGMGLLLASCKVTLQLAGQTVA
ncbi:diguanylate cyclase, partial [Salmonella enterica subsp. enterica serovar Typhimurium]